MKFEKLTLVLNTNLIDAVNCITKEKGDAWKVTAHRDDKNKELYIRGFRGSFSYNTFESLPL